MTSSRPLCRLKCARSVVPDSVHGRSLHIFNYYKNFSQTYMTTNKTKTYINKVTSHHAIPGPKWPLIMPSSDRSDLRSYYFAPEPNPRPCNFGLGTHRERWVWSNQRSLLDGVLTWVRIFEMIETDNANLFALYIDFKKKQHHSLRCIVCRQFIDFCLKQCFAFLALKPVSLSDLTIANGDLLRVRFEDVI